MHDLEFLKLKGITDLIFLDFETFYSIDYTLKKLSTSMYIFDDQFLIHGVGITHVQNNKSPSTKYITDFPAMKKCFNLIDWTKTALIAHHTHFDGLILTHYFGHTPAYYMCTLSMARPILQNLLPGLDIDTIAKHFGIPGKLEGLDNTKGKRELTLEEAKALGNYCIHDVYMLYQVFYKLLHFFVEFEMNIIDWHVRMYTEGEYIVDAKLADKEITRIETEKSAMFKRVSKLFPPSIIVETEIDVLKALRSSIKLAEIIDYNNLKVPHKISPTTNKETYAFAKNDLAFMAFKNNLTHAAAPLIFEARTTAKSDTALNKAKLLRKFADFPPFPMYINYARAQTLRSSGGDKVQGQNLPRGGNARKCLTAPKDHVCLSIDSSGIELRVALWLAGQKDMMKLVNEGKDLYKVMASHIYEVEYDQITKNQRSIGKVAILSLQYMAGIPTFDTMLKSGAMAAPIILPLDEVKRIHQTYRRVFDQVPLLWSKCGNFLYAMTKSCEKYPTPKAKDRIEYKGAIGVEYKGMKFVNERAYTHHGMNLYYPELTEHNGSFKYKSGSKTKHIYSGLFTNNLCQHIARNIVYFQIGLLNERYKPIHTVHDEATIIVHKDEFDRAKTYAEKCFSTAPDYFKGIDLKGESEWGFNAEEISYYAK